jgi:hypothetical protein
VTSAPTANDLAAPDAFRRVQTPWGAVVLCAALAGVARHAFTLRNIDLHADRNGSARGWDAIAAWLGASGPVHRARQVHGAGIVHAEGPVPADRPDGDILVATRPGVAVAVQVADCVPLLFADARTGAVAAAHAGWRGTASGVAIRAVEALRDLARTDPADLVVAIGPCIGPCCYEVGPEVRDAFLTANPAADGWFAAGAPGRWLLDLWRANCDQLAAAGVPPGQVHLAGLCTMSDTASFFSYRAEGAAAGRACGAIRAGGPA